MARTNIGLHSVLSEHASSVYSQNSDIIALSYILQLEVVILVTYVTMERRTSNKFVSFIYYCAYAFHCVFSNKHENSG